MSTVQTEFHEAHKYLDETERNINKKISSLSTINKAEILLDIPSDSDLESLVSNLKQKNHIERSKYISEYIDNLNYNINDTNEIYDGFSESFRTQQLDTLNKKLEKIKDIRNDPEVLHDLNLSIQKKNLKVPPEA